MVGDELAEAQRAVLARYGVRAESRMIDLASIGGPAHVLVSGEGPPVMMVVGAGDSVSIWAPLMARLDGYRLYAVELPGQGWSQGVRYATATLRHTAVAFLSEVVESLGLDSAAFVSHSMGGLWTAWLALDEPQRVSSISFVACPALILGTSAPLPMRLASIPTLARVINRIAPPSPSQARRTMRMVGEEPIGLDEMVRLLVATNKMPGADAALSALLHSAITLRGARPEVALGESELRQITQSVQFIWGENDPFGDPSIGERAARVMPDARFHRVGGGHAPWLHHSAAVGEHISEFLSHNTTKPHAEERNRE